MAHGCQRLFGRRWRPGDIRRVTAVSVDLNVTSDVDVPDAASLAALSGLVRYVLDHERACGAWVIGIRFTSDDEIRRVHREFMGIDSATDIMTFPHGGDGEDFPGASRDEVGGDLMISIDHARANAETAGWSTGDEVLFLIAHGILHLLGWDDHSDAKREAMLSRQYVLLERWKTSGTLS